MPVMFYQHAIIMEMKFLIELDVQLEIVFGIDFIKSTLNSSDLITLVLWISGGVDSSTCGRLAQLAVTELNTTLHNKTTDQFQFIAVRLPYGVQADEDDAKQALDFIEP
mgnify:CR=1 FL=1